MAGNAQPNDPQSIDRGQVLYSVSASRTFNFWLLIVLSLAATFLIAYHAVLPTPFFITGLVLVSAGILATGAAIISTRPVIVVTGEGIIYQPRRFPMIEFGDIAELMLVPRVRKSKHGRFGRRTHSYIQEKWRPVVLGLANFEKYSAKLPRIVRLGVRHPTNPNLARLEIQFMGLNGDSREFYRIVRERAPNAQWAGEAEEIS